MQKKFVLYTDASFAMRIILQFEPSSLATPPTCSFCKLVLNSIATWGNLWVPKCYQICCKTTKFSYPKNIGSYFTLHLEKYLHTYKP